MKGGDLRDGEMLIIRGEAADSSQYTYIQVHLRKFENGEKVFSCNLFQKVKLSYILDSLHFLFLSFVFKFFVLILMISAYG